MNAAKSITRRQNERSDVRPFAAESGTAAHFHATRIRLSRSERRQRATTSVPPSPLLFSLHQRQQCRPEFAELMCDSAVVRALGGLGHARELQSPYAAATIPPRRREPPAPPLLVDHSSRECRPSVCRE